MRENVRLFWFRVAIKIEACSSRKNKSKSFIENGQSKINFI